MGVGQPRYGGKSGLRLLESGLRWWNGGLKRWKSGLRPWTSGLVSGLGPVCPGPVCPGLCRFVPVSLLFFKNIVFIKNSRLRRGGFSAIASAIDLPSKPETSAKPAKPAKPEHPLNLVQTRGFTNYLGNSAKKKPKKN